jgi:hypothetical protein
MIQTLRLKVYVMLVKNFLSVSLILFLSGCGDMPKVIHQLDTKHGVANPMKIVKIDRVKCKIKTEPLPPIPIMSKEMHGAYCLTSEEAARYKASLEAECLNDKHEQVSGP